MKNRVCKFAIMLLLNSVVGVSAFHNLRAMELSQEDSIRKKVCEGTSAMYGSPQIFNEWCGDVFKSNMAEEVAAAFENHLSSLERNRVMVNQEQDNFSVNLDSIIEILENRGIVNKTFDVGQKFYENPEAFKKWFCDIGGSDPKIISEEVRNNLLVMPPHVERDSESEIQKRENFCANQGYLRNIFQKDSLEEKEEILFKKLRAYDNIFEDLRQKTPEFDGAIYYQVDNPDSPQEKKVDKKEVGGYKGTGKKRWRKKTQQETPPPPKLPYGNFSYTNGIYKRGYIPPSIFKKDVDTNVSYN